MSDPFETAMERLSIRGSRIHSSDGLAADEDLIVRSTTERSTSHTLRLTIGEGGTVGAHVGVRQVIEDGTPESAACANGFAVAQETARRTGNIAARSAAIAQGAHVMPSLTWLAAEPSMGPAASRRIARAVRRAPPKPGDGPS